MLRISPNVEVCVDLQSIKVGAKFRLVVKAGVIFPIFPLKNFVSMLTLSGIVPISTSLEKNWSTMALPPFPWQCPLPSQFIP